MSERKAPTGTIAGPCMDTTWQTPPELLDAVRLYFGGPIPFDAASAADNPTAARAFCHEGDVSLLPCARWEQGYFQAVLCVATHLCLIRRRVDFVRAGTGERVSGNPYANMFIGWNTNAARWIASFRGVGSCLSVGGLTGPPDMPNRGPTGEAPPEQAALFDGATT